MRISRKHAPEITAHKGTGAYDRPNIQPVFLDVEKRRLISTDGHRMTIVPCIPDDGDTSGPIQVSVFESARKAAKKQKSPDYEIKADGRVEYKTGNGVTTETRYEFPEGMQFPPWEKVIPDTANGTYKAVGVNAEYLADAIKALGSTNVKLYIGGELDPIVITPPDKLPEEDGAMYIVMPCRL